MTTQLKAQLLEYAMEDTGYAIDGGSMSITDTKSGVISINHNEGLFQAFNNMGEALTENMDREKMQGWIIGQYIIEA